MKTVSMGGREDFMSSLCILLTVKHFIKDMIYTINSHGMDKIFETQAQPKPNDL